MQFQQDLTWAPFLYGGGHGLRTPDEVFFHQNPKLLVLGRQIGQTNWEDKFWGIWGIFGQAIGPILVL